MRLLDTSVLSVVTYGSESGTVIKQMEKSLMPLKINSLEDCYGSLSTISGRRPNKLCWATE